MFLWFLSSSLFAHVGRLACGGVFAAFATVKTPQGEELSLPAVICSREDNCQEVVRRLQSGESVLIKDPVFYRVPGLDPTGYEIPPRACTGESTMQPSDSPACSKEMWGILANQISPSESQEGQWSARLWILTREGELVPPEEFVSSFLLPILLENSIYRYPVVGDLSDRRVQNVEVLEQVEEIAYLGNLRWGYAGNGTRGCVETGEIILEDRASVPRSLGESSYVVKAYLQENCVVPKSLKPDSLSQNNESVRGH